MTQDQGRFTWISPHDRVFVIDGRGTHTRRPRVRGACPDIYWSSAA